MTITELTDSLPPEAIEAIKRRGIDKLTPPQELAVKHGLLKGKNMVVAAPTASGKTLIAEMAMLRSVMWDRKKAVYIAPMRALVTEKYEEFKEAYPFLRIAMSIGDLDSVDHWLDKFDIIFVSTEKFDSLIRHGVNWLDSIGCIIFDEVHMLDDGGRGPTLEVLITRLRRTSRHAQLLALSATIGNADDIAKWLGAELIESDYRPVLLEKGIVLNDKAYFEDREEELLGSHKIPEIRVTEDTLERKKQLLIFYSTKRNTEAGAEKLSLIVERYLSDTEKTRLKDVAKTILGALSKPTLQCEKLAKYVERGVAFHHSGLVNAQRHAVEDAFRNGLLKALCATTTLCMPAGEEVMCNPEPKAIADINNGDRVLTNTGTFKKVVQSTKRNFDGQLIKIYPYYNLPMKMTPEHRVLVVKRKRRNIHSKGESKWWWTYSQPDWIEAKGLKHGDLVIYPRLKEEKNITELTLDEIGPLVNQTGTVGRHWTRLKTNTISLNKNALEVFGLFVAEGSTGKNGVIKFDISTKEEDLTQIITMWLHKQGLNCTIRDNERHRRSIVGCSKQLATKFRLMFGHTASRKRLPDKFILLPKSKLVSLVKGLWKGDGSTYYRKTYGEAKYSTVSKVLAKQLFAILVKLGYMPSLQKKPPSAKRRKYIVDIKSRFPAYVITISGKQLIRFASEVLGRDVQFSGNRTYNIGQIDNDYFYMPVRRLEEEPFKGTVYNLEVEDDASYVGSFVVHNSLGINLPAHTVLVRDTTRYSDEEGAEKISVNDVTQLFGRAGRPKYDKIGRALLIAKYKSDIMDIYARYMNAELEPISSKLGAQPVLRTHILAFVASDFLRSAESILDFLKGTFYGYEYANSKEMGLITQDILDELLSWGFVEKRGSIYNATRMGARVSELYIDPLSAKWIIDTLPKVEDEIGNLFMITNTIEMRPYVRGTEEAEEKFFEYEKMTQSSVNYEAAEQIYYDPLKPFSTALLLNEWISEKTEPEIVSKYGTTPGALYSKITNADWMLYAGMEIAKIMHANTTRLLELRVRMRYGIKKELVDLTRLEQVGRVRARLMYNSGIHKVTDLRKPGSDERLRILFGKEIAKRIMDQVNTVD